MIRSDGARRQVVILGGGFAGLRAAKALAGAPVEVTLVDRRNHHLFQPLLYQVATAALNPSDIAYPIRAALRRQRNARTILAAARDFDLEARRVVLDDGELPYDWLIVATGATHSYFGNDSWEPFAPGLKTIEDALDIRARVLLAFEAAEREAVRGGGAADRAAWQTFVVVGGGPTGVELAGALAEISRRALTRDFRVIDPSSSRVVLIEGGDRVLATYPEALSLSARRQLESLGVEVRTGTMVVGVDGHHVALASGESIPARTVLWAAGVKASPLAARLGVPLDRAGRVRVAPDLSVPGHPEVFVAGDLVAFEQDGAMVPGVAPAAIQAGAHAARCIRADLRGAERRPFRYRDKGSLATIGWARAVADLGRFRFSGTFAWLLWMLIHISYLIGFRNRLFVLLGWAWSYVTFRRGARLITGG